LSRRRPSRTICSAISSGSILEIGRLGVGRRRADQFQDFSQGEAEPFAFENTQKAVAVRGRHRRVGARIGAGG
jgi:hypothetical protein